MLEDKIHMLQGTPIFEDLGAADLQDVAHRLIRLEFESGDLLFREGAPGHYICFLTHGALDVFKNTSGDEQVAIAEILPGRSVGEMSIIDGLTCSATVTARTPSRVLALTRDDFDEILQENPRLGAEIYKGISRLLSMSLRRTSLDLAEARSDSS